MDKIKYNIIKGTIDQYAMFEENITSDVAGIDIRYSRILSKFPQKQLSAATTSAIRVSIALIKVSIYPVLVLTLHIIK